MSTFIALLRGINVSGHNKIPMAELRSLCGGLGWSDVQSYIQSGNLVFGATSDPASLETELERAKSERPQSASITSSMIPYSKASSGT